VLASAPEVIASHTRRRDPGVPHGLDHRRTASDLGGYIPALGLGIGIPVSETGARTEPEHAMKQTSLGAGRGHRQKKGV
jgi:hypothetical protein